MLFAYVVPTENFIPFQALPPLFFLTQPGYLLGPFVLKMPYV